MRPYKPYCVKFDLMPRRKKIKITREGLIRRGFPVVMAGILATAAGWGIKSLADLNKVANYQKWEAAHPYSVSVKKVVDGDTFEISKEKTVRVLGIDAPNRGEKGDKEAADALSKMIDGKKVWLEYDRYQDDKFGRMLAWVWIGCEESPKFLAYDYMRLSYNRSKPGLTENPVGCKKGKLVNEEMVKKGFARVEFFKDRGEMKYQKRLLSF